METSVQISGIILAYNEEQKIVDCIRSLKEVCDEIIVVDSHSNDNTVQLASDEGAKVIQNSFLGFIEQRSFAMNQASFNVVLAVEADERLSDELRHSIMQVKENWQKDSYTFNRLNNYCGKWLRYSWYPDRKLRLWDRRKGKPGGINPHDQVVMDEGCTTSKLKGDLLHLAYENLEEHYAQVNKFAVTAAHSKFAKGKKVNFIVHLILNPWYKFVRKYLFRLGFLDGYYGFIFCAITAYLNFLKYARLWELNRSKHE